ncbi:MAG TPA: hypothetical protein VL652_07905 [Kutzneria sp.]|nr:hypothetical protein [Kutzneria sp.]
MRWRAIGVVAVLLATACTAAPPPVPQPPHWQLIPLPLPAGSAPHATAELQASDGHGGYAGMVFRGGGRPPAVGMWHDGRVDVHEAPGDPMTGSIRVLGESRDDTVLIEASSGYFTLDRAGVYHPVSTSSLDGGYPQFIGPNGDLVGEALDPDNPGNYLAVYWPSPSAEPSRLEGMQGGSKVQAIDDEGTVLVNCACGIYLLHQGETRLLDGSGQQGWSIAHGVVAGSGSDRDSPGGVGIVWMSPDSPQVQENSHILVGVNSHGLSVGEERDSHRDHGAAAAWQDGHELGRLPAADGLPFVRAKFVDEDGTIAGTVSPDEAHSDGGPVQWRFVRG